MNPLSTLLEIIIAAFIVLVIALIGMGKIDKSVADSILCDDCEIARINAQNTNTTEENMTKFQSQLEEMQNSEEYKSINPDESQAQLEAEIEALRNQD